MKTPRLFRNIAVLFILVVALFASQPGVGITHANQPEIVMRRSARPGNLARTVLAPQLPILPRPSVVASVSSENESSACSHFYEGRISTHDQRLVDQR